MTRWLAALCVCASIGCAQPTPTSPATDKSAGGEVTATSPAKATITATPTPTPTPPARNNALGVITMHVAPTVDPAASGDVEVVLHSRRSSELLAVLQQLHGDARLDAEGLVRLRLSRPPRPATDAVTAQHTTPSFVIDYDEPVVQELIATLKARHPAPTMDQLVAEVQAQIPEAQHGTFRIASRALSQHRGDCTEHAVSLAALSRAFGKPARVAFGLILPLGMVDYAFGHAWVQAHDGSAWQTHDSAFPHAGAIHIPMIVMSDESVTYGASNRDGMLLMSIEQVDVVPAASPAP